MLPEPPDCLGPVPLAPTFERALASDSAAAWGAACEVVGPRVLAFPLLTLAACESLLGELDRRIAARASSAATAPNSMHSYGAILAELGLDPVLEYLEQCVRSLVQHHFADLESPESLGGQAFDGRHGFLAEYGLDFDDALGFHVDDSAVTLNLCLGTDFSGSEIYFRGPRCDLHRQTPAHQGEAFELDHRVGTALLHAGRNRHGVHPIRRGRRRNLILWLQSSAAKEAASRCQPWCGAFGAFGNKSPEVG